MPLPTVIGEVIMHATNAELASQSFLNLPVVKIRVNNTLPFLGMWHAINCPFILVINTLLFSFLFFFLIHVNVQVMPWHTSVERVIDFYWKTEGWLSCWICVQFRAYKLQLSSFHWLQSLLDKVSSAKYWTYLQQTEWNPNTFENKNHKAFFKSWFLIAVQS